MMFPKYSLAENDVTPLQTDGSREQLNTACLQAESDPGLREQLLALPISVEADELLLQEDTAIYQGDVRVEHNCVLLEASNASMDINDKVVRLSGDVHMQLPQAELHGDGASFSLEDNSSSLSGARYRIDARPNIYGSADLISMDTNRSVTIDSGSYTRCEPEDKDWEVTASQIKLNPQTGQGSARNAVVKIAKTPVLYVPYMRFPIGGQRQSGFLFPEITNRSEGFDLVIPYYFNLAENYDLLFRPKYKAGSGYITEISSRWLNWLDSWKLDGLFIDSDENADNDTRWMFSLTEASYHSGHWETKLDISRSSDEDVVRDLQTNSFSVSRSSALASTGSVKWLDEWGELGLAVENYQSIDPLLEIPSEKQPEFWADIYLPLGSGPVLTFNSTYTVFDSSELASTTGEDRAQRITGNVYTFYPFSLSGIELEAGVGSDYRHYHLENTSAMLLGGEQSAWINVPFAKITLRSSIFKNGSNGVQSVISPVLDYRARFMDAGEDYLSSVPVFDSAFARTNHLQWYGDQTSVGGDFIETRDSVRAGVRYSASSERQKLSTEIGVLNYFERSLANGITASEQNGGLRAQQWLFSGSWHFQSNWRSNLQLLYSEREEELDMASASIRYRASDSLFGNASLSPLLNLGYHYRRDDARFVEEQDVEIVDFSTSVPISSRWGLFTRFQYDLEHNRDSEALAGLEFDDCCVKFRLVYREGIIYDAASLDGDRDRAIVAQIQLKGLGGIGQAVDSLLEESIRGFNGR